MRILIPDAQYQGEPDVERAAAPPGTVLDVPRATNIDQIPAASWQACDAVILYHGLSITSEVVARLDNCRIVVRAGIGYDNIDIAACAERGIVVSNCPDYGVTDVADHAMGLLLSLLRGIVFFHGRLCADPVGGWRFDAPPLIGRLRGRRFGIIGLGRIGTATARRAQAFETQVTFYDPYLRAGHELAVGTGRADTLEELLEGSDIVSLHVPLTEETRGMVGRDVFARMNEGAVLLNTARGEVVDLDALYEALKSGRLAGAGIDVQPDEPPDPSHPLIRAFAAQEDWLAGRLTLTPHAAFYSPASIADLRRKPVETVSLYLTEKRLRNCVNAGRLAAAGHSFPESLSVQNEAGGR